jgi:hypothetical protein
MLQTMFNVSLLCFFRLNEYPCPTEIQLRIKLAALLLRMNERTRLLLLLETVNEKTFACFVLCLSNKI